MTSGGKEMALSTITNQVIHGAGRKVLCSDCVSTPSPSQQSRIPEMTFPQALDHEKSATTAPDVSADLEDAARVNAEGQDIAIAIVGNIDMLSTPRLRRELCARLTGFWYLP